MKCSSCRIGRLNPSYLEGLFVCHTCSECEGNFILLRDYLRWKNENPDVDLGERVDPEVVPQETSKAMICPKTGGLMTKYKISADTDHRIDLSPGINAIWLDKGEWELLKAKGLATKLNRIFTDHWQHEIRSNEAVEVLSALYERKFGDRYDEVKQLRSSLESMENRSEVIAYLLADDPYEI